MRSLLIGLLLCGVIGCSQKQITPPAPPVVVTVTPEPKPVPVAPKVEKRTDLPANWFEVKGADWSYGLPMGFDAVKNSTTVEHKSLTQNLTIQFDRSETDKEADDVISAFIDEQHSNSGFVVDVRVNNHVSPPIIAVHTVVPTSPLTYEGHLDFFVKQDKIVYHMACYTDAVNLKTEAHTCFEVIKTLKVK